MIQRDLRKRDVLVISDHPLENEQRRSTSYSEPSQVTFKDALNTSSFNICKDIEDKYLLNSTTICYTYLSTERYDKEDFDFATSIVAKKDIPQGMEYINIPWLKDTWVTIELFNQIQATIEQIKAVEPKLVVIAGKWSFLFLAALQDIPAEPLATIAATKSKPDKKKMFGVLAKYRSSILSFNVMTGLPRTVVMPILTPAYHFLVKDKAFAIKMDYNKIARIHRRLCEGASIEDILQDKRVRILGTDKKTVLEYLAKFKARLDSGITLAAFDCETRMKAQDCIGISYDPYESLTIPFSAMEDYIHTETGIVGYKKLGSKEETSCEILPESTCRKYYNFWSIEDEIEIMSALWEVMLHPNCHHVGQNYLYDSQWFHHEWRLDIKPFCDTMILHHVLYNYMQKDLAFLASIYCDDFVYWKDELDVKDNMVRWSYNGKDCCYTLSIAEILLGLIKLHGGKIEEFYNFQQFEVVPNVITIMNRGVKTDIKKKDALNSQFSALMQGCIEKINYIFGEEVNLNSTPQVRRAFKDLLGIKPVVNRKTRRESFGSDAMLVYLEMYPEWRTLLTLFLEYKSIKVFVRTFLSAKVDDDGHMRCSYNPAGTKTYRFGSRKNAFGNGMNLANIPSKGKIDLRVALQEIETEEEEEKEEEKEIASFSLTDGTVIDTEVILQDTEEESVFESKLQLPNCKEIFLPSNNNWMFFDADYSSIDLHFVVWESDCKFLKDIMKAGKDVYAILASHYYQREIKKKDPERQTFKSVCHGTNYLGKAPTLAAKAGLSVVAVNKVIQWYFKECPEIPAWHKRIEMTARKQGFVENVFGARFWVTDFTDPMWMNKIVAAVPQSSAAILVNKGLCNLEKNEQGKIQVLLQVHDSLAGQFKASDVTAPDRIKSYMEIEIPYADKLVIPAQLKVSPLSYGACD